MDKENKEMSAKERLDIILKNYLANNPRSDRKVNEIEMRFCNTNSKTKRRQKPLIKIDFDNVAQCLCNNGFKVENPNGFHSLRIFHEYLDANDGKHKMSNIRTELVGLDMIQNYCRTNSLQKLLDMPSMNYEKLKFTQKTRPKHDDDFIVAADFEEFHTRISYQLEQSYTAHSNIIRGIIQKWSDSKKTFRLLNRVRFVHDTLPLFADLSIVKKSKTTNGHIPMKFYTVQDSGVFESAESYEIEMELNNTKVGPGTDYNDVKSLIGLLRSSMRTVLGGLQRTNYPISYVEQENTCQEYMKLLHGDTYEESRVMSWNFIGPSSNILRIRNILELDENISVPNIRKDYTVTEKADGERMLLYINGNGKIYMLNSNMSVIFTGTKTMNKEVFNSLLDGEFIEFDKKGSKINLYAAFDLYYKNKTDLRGLPFYESEGDANLEKKPEYRLNLLQLMVSRIEPQSVVETKKHCEFNISCKMFYSTASSTSIFEGCSRILSDVDDGIYQYHTDGLIFTPSNKAVGSESLEEVGPLKKTTWNSSFKWKPIEQTTIDFLVTIKKDKTGKDEIHNIFEDGVNLEKGMTLSQYKTLVLRCGFDKKKHGYLNPFNDVINENFENANDLDDSKSYQPVPFQPTNPYDTKACYANILLQQNNNENVLMTSQNEMFEENMIVEFQYDTTRPKGWRWIPIRVRYDKTTDLRNGIPNYGNAYHVANSNWQSIHHPITIKMITQGMDIPEQEDENQEENDDSVTYYSRDEHLDQKNTRSLRDFHNLYVKRKLISNVANKGDTLIDYAVGKAGDLSKWVHSKYSFVFGIDINRDNIHNRLDGACARYLKEVSKMKKHPSALFVNGTSSENIRNGGAFKKPHGTEKDKEITDAVFGIGPKDMNVLGKSPYTNYGVATNGFNVSACMFALHYFFENAHTLHNFIRNVAECTALNGYFIGCCYDGQKVFNLLSDKSENESIVINNGNKKVYEITKLYSQTGFSDDETSFGYKIDVFQDTIGRPFKEYLVNFNYFVRLMENYGLVLLTKEEAVAMGFPNGSGYFEEMFNNLESEIQVDGRIKSNYKNAHLMTDNEKLISFLNRYFVFRKVRNLNVERIFKNVFSRTAEEVEDEKTGKEEVAQPVIKKSKTKIRIRKEKTENKKEEIDEKENYDDDKEEDKKEDDESDKKDDQNGEENENDAQPKIRIKIKKSDK